MLGKAVSHPPEDHSHSFLCPLQNEAAIFYMAFQGPFQKVQLSKELPQKAAVYSQSGITDNIITIKRNPIDTFKERCCFFCYPYYFLHIF